MSGAALQFIKTRFTEYLYVINYAQFRVALAFTITLLWHFIVFLGVTLSCKINDCGPVSGDILSVNAATMSYWA